MRHLETAVIIDFVGKRLSEAESASCSAHIEACLVCAEAYHFWWQFHSTIASERLIHAPEQLMERCLSIFPGAPAETGFRRVFCRVVFDTFLQPAPALAIRGEADARQMVFHGEDVDIHLRISGAGKQTVQGQILTRGDETAVNGAQVSLLALGRATLSATSDNLGFFDFRDVPRAPLIMSIKLHSRGLVGVLSVSESNTGG